jgi:hypothetical protein
VASGRSGAQGEFGETIPVWPSTDNYQATRCPRGHVLSIGGVTTSYNHIYSTRDITCLVCHKLNPKTASWALIDPTRQVTPDAVRGTGLELVAIPPPIRAGIGRIELRLDGDVLGDIDLTLCSVDQRGVIEHVRVDRGRYRRHGYSRLLVAAARARGPNYTWTTTNVEDTVEARAFWATVGWPGVGEPKYCSHQQEAADATP